jgi:hypothetical protein
MQLFSLEEIEKLNSILKLIMPAGDSGMPEAELILNSINLDNISHQKFVEISKRICEKTDQKCIKNNEDLGQFKKANFRDFSVFVNLVLMLYYSNKNVLKKLEVGSIPPFPEGNFVKEGDLYLLEQVFIKGPIYRQ